jgi:hypothetical protein
LKFYICWRPWLDGTLYVQQVPGDGGKDWGYTAEAKKAIPISTYWMRRFVADCRYCRSNAGVREVSAEKEAA